ncbi:hypothetical protein [Flavobacterium aquiphilum]|uniref:hypothetical protein n=1 Tax=Flavobacterium aquiphilum TaxID=3003261 RepID=UPI0024812AD6|nr:hypothetical protein [Flavobacterium aquiphilum]
MAFRIGTIKPTSIFNTYEMEKLLFIILIVLTFCSCVTNNAGFDSKSQKEIMDSWVWKIFVFTDLGEFTPAKTTKQNW